jgi:predicted nucleic acid-binding protein
VRVALDTNILVYAEGVDGPVRKAATLGALQHLDGEDVFVPVQVLGEFFAVLTRKLRWDQARAQRAVALWCERTTPVPTTEAVLAAAMDLATRHRLQSWDAVVLAAAAQAECRLLLSEDMQDGFTWRGVTVRNPFAAPG